MRPVSVLLPVEDAGLREADEHVVPRRAELLEEARLVVLDPGINSAGAFDRGGLVPVGAFGRIDQDRVLGGVQVLDQGDAVGIGQDDAAAAYLDGAIAVVCRAQRIGECVLRDLAARRPVGSAGLQQVDVETR
jgi:hypothetical protein